MNIEQFRDMAWRRRIQDIHRGFQETRLRLLEALAECECIRAKLEHQHEIVRNTICTC